MPPRISLTLIVRNEERNLPACLAAAADLVDETVVVDTGSTDATREIAARHGARVFDFPWIDDFAAARNEALRHATGDWILWLDADDRLDEANRSRFRTLRSQLPDPPLPLEAQAAYTMQCWNLPNAATGASTILDQGRLFRRHPAIRWQYRVHEQILLSVRRLGGAVLPSNVVIHHTGYQAAPGHFEKHDRNVRLLELDLRDHPNDPYVLFNLGWTLQQGGQLAMSVPLLEQALQLARGSYSFEPKLYALLSGAYFGIGRQNEALQLCRQGRARFPHDSELLFKEALLLRDTGDLAAAEACFVRLLGEPAHPQAQEMSNGVEAGLRGHKARHNLASLLMRQGRLAEAEQQWRLAVAERPEYPSAWLGLGELYLSQSRWSDLEQTIRHLEAQPGRFVESAVLRARSHMDRREFAAATAVLKGVIDRAPQALWPRVVLSHVYLLEGRDRAGAERALRDVLALEPNHPEARANLAALLRPSPT